jgi:oligopeptide/dipeptide ABC transporter ATP-binding protein
VVHAVRGVSFTVEPGDVLGIVGESGAGKSITALAVMGLLPSWARVSGSVRLRGHELLGATDRRMADVRGLNMAMVFQDPTTALNPVHTVGRQIVNAVRAHQTIGKKQARERAVELLGIVGIPEPARRAAGYPHEFSGGMRQRVLIAMAMANDPDVIIADEPTTALDVTVQAQVLETLEKARAETHAAIVLITHDLGVIARMAQRVMVMYAGRAVETGPVETIYHHSRMPYTLALLGSVPRLDADDANLVQIRGTAPSAANLPPGCPFWPRCPLSRDECHQQEPELRAVDGEAHEAACHYSGELVPGALTREV